MSSFRIKQFTLTVSETQIIDLLMPRDLTKNYPFDETDLDNFVKIKAIYNDLDPECGFLLSKEAKVAYIYASPGENKEKVLKAFHTVCINCSFDYIELQEFSEINQIKAISAGWYAKHYKA